MAGEPLALAQTEDVGLGAHGRERPVVGREAVDRDLQGRGRHARPLLVGRHGVLVGVAHEGGGAGAHRLQ